MKLARGGSEAKSFRIMGSPTLHSPLSSSRIQQNVTLAGRSFAPSVVLAAKEQGHGGEGERMRRERKREEEPGQ